MDPRLIAALALIGGYLLGSIPFGLLITRFAGTEDLRSIGSGNIGATNVLRTGRKGLAAATLILDGAKGAVAVLLAAQLGPGLGALGGIGAFYGHIFPVWLGFRGGKGVATYLGVALALAWPCGLAFAAAWIVMTLATRISSVGGMSGGIAASAVALVLGRIDAFFVLAAFAITVLWTHRANIGRLIAGTEPRVGRR